MDVTSESEYFNPGEKIAERHGGKKKSEWKR